LNLTILGKSNNMISLMLDAWYEKYLAQTVVTIVQNIPVDDTPDYKLPKLDSFTFSQVDADGWDSEYEHLVLGVIRVPTKRAVFESFFDSHKIEESDYTTFSHPSAVISRQSELGSGVFIGPASVIAPYVELGNLVTLNRSVTVGHHTTIGDFSTLNPGVNIAGGSSIGANSTIGMGTNIFDGVNIGSNTVVGAGSVVTNDLPGNVVAYGTPAVVIKSNKELRWSSHA
jgi:sugar O-acyltransferase (sialic acid O-acetyltransferase NeuD family)